MCEITNEPEGAGRTEQLIRQARAGSAEALGRLLEGCRAYLLLVASKGLDANLQAKAGASDLVQRTFMEAQRDFAKFQGGSQRELLNWLLSVLHHTLHDFRRFHNAKRRKVKREQSISGVEVAIDSPPPVDKAAATEEGEAVLRAMERLPEDYRLVVAMRHQERLSWDDIARRMGRKVETVRKLWFRAVARLRQEMHIPPEPE
jgi:RNA polymerase sigma-70 factor (ECF subfamily)